MFNHIEEKLPQNVEGILVSNLLKTYCPIRSKGNDFDWDVVSGYVLSILLHKQIKQKFDVEKLKDYCQKVFSDRLDDPSIWKIIENMYFANEVLSRIAPEFALIKADTGKISEKDKRLGALYQSLICNSDLTNKPITVPSHMNFLEKEIFEVLSQNLENKKPTCSDKTYLPFLADCFRKDIRFFEEHPAYLLSELTNFLRLYAFLYCTQLALNIMEWRQAEPVSKPLYFILENEKASSERSWISSCGFKSFSEAAKKIFPMLSMLENLNKGSKIKYPLWWYSQQLNLIDKDKRQSISKILTNFAHAFKEKRGLDYEIPKNNDPLDLIESLMVLSYLQFDKNQPIEKIKPDTVKVNEDYVSEIISEICSDFIVSRGRAGRVMVINQDFLILLTNLAIGKHERLRFNELLHAYQKRGVYFDKQSEVVLVNFFERIGNIERLSDSGEAVYVYKTI